MSETNDFSDSTAGNNICIPVIFNNPLKAFFGKEIDIIIQTHPTQIVKNIFLSENLVYLCTQLITYIFCI